MTYAHETCIYRFIQLKFNVANVAFDAHHNNCSESFLSSIKYLTYNTTYSIWVEFGMPFNRNFERNIKISHFFNSKLIERSFQSSQLFSREPFICLFSWISFFFSFILFLFQCVYWFPFQFSPQKKKVCHSFVNMIESMGPLTERWSKMNIQQQKIGGKKQIHDYLCTMSDGIV